MFSDSCNFLHSVTVKAAPDRQLVSQSRSSADQQSIPIVTVHSPRSVRSPVRSPRLSGLLLALKDVIGEDEDDVFSEEELSAVQENETTDALDASEESTPLVSGSSAVTSSHPIDEPWTFVQELKDKINVNPATLADADASDVQEPPSTMTPPSNMPPSNEDYDTDYTPPDYTDIPRQTPDLLSPVDLSNLPLLPFIRSEYHKGDGSFDSGYADWTGPRPMALSPPRSPSISSTFDLLSSPFGTPSSRVMSHVGFGSFIPPSSPLAYAFNSPKFHASPERDSNGEFNGHSPDSDIEGEQTTRFEGMQSLLHDDDDDVDVFIGEPLDEEHDSGLSTSAWDSEGGPTAIYMGTPEYSLAYDDARPMSVESGGSPDEMVTPTGDDNRSASGSSTPSSSRSPSPSCSHSSSDSHEAEDQSSFAGAFSPTEVQMGSMFDSSPPQSPSASQSPISGSGDGHEREMLEEIPPASGSSSPHFPSASESRLSSDSHDMEEMRQLFNPPHEDIFPAPASNSPQLPSPFESPFLDYDHGGERLLSSITPEEENHSAFASGPPSAPESPLSGQSHQLERSLSFASHDEDMISSFATPERENHSTSESPFSSHSHELERSPSFASPGGEIRSTFTSSPPRSSSASGSPFSGNDHEVDDPVPQFPSTSQSPFLDDSYGVERLPSFAPPEEEILSASASSSPESLATTHSPVSSDEVERNSFSTRVSPSPLQDPWSASASNSPRHSSYSDSPISNEIHEAEGFSYRIAASPPIEDQDEMSADPEVSTTDPVLYASDPESSFSSDEVADHSSFANTFPPTQDAIYSAFEGSTAHPLQFTFGSRSPFSSEETEAADDIEPEQEPASYFDEEDEDEIEDAEDEDEASTPLNIGFAPSAFDDPEADDTFEISPTAQLAYLSDPTVTQENDTLNSLYDVYGLSSPEATTSEEAHPVIPAQEESSQVANKIPLNIQTGTTATSSATPMSAWGRVFTPPLTRGRSGTIIASPSSVRSPATRERVESPFKRLSTASTDKETDNIDDKGAQVVEVSTKVPFGFRHSFALVSGSQNISLLSSHRARI